MAFTLADAVVELRARGAEQVQSALGRTRSAFNQFQAASKGAETGLGAFSSRLSNVLVGIGSIGALRGMVGEMVEAEEASLGLRAALSGTQEEISANAERIEGWADQLSKKIALDDEEIVKLATFAASLGVAGNKIEEVTQQGIALAKALRLPAQIGVKAVSLQAQGGNLGRVRNLLPQLEGLDDLETARVLQEKAAVGMRILSAEAEGLGGSLCNLGITVGNLVEKFDLTGTIRAFTGVLQTVVDAISGLSPFVLRAVGAVVLFTTAFGAASFVLRPVIDAVGTLIPLVLRLLTMLGAIAGAALGSTTAAMAGMSVATASQAAVTKAGTNTAWGYVQAETAVGVANAKATGSILARTAATSAAAVANTQAATSTSAWSVAMESIGVGAKQRTLFDAGASVAGVGPATKQLELFNTKVQAVNPASLAAANATSKLGGALAVIGNLAASAAIIALPALIGSVAVSLFNAATAASKFHDELAKATTPGALDIESADIAIRGPQGEERFQEAIRAEQQAREQLAQLQERQGGGEGGFLLTSARAFGEKIKDALGGDLSEQIADQEKLVTSLGKTTRAMIAAKEAAARQAGAAGEAAGPNNALNEEIGKLENKLQKEIDLFGLSGAAAEAYALKLRGATADQLADVQARETRLTQLKREQEAGKILEDTKLKAAEAGMTPEEKQVQQLRRLGTPERAIGAFTDNLKQISQIEASGELQKMADAMERQIKQFGLSEELLRAEELARKSGNKELFNTISQRSEELKALERVQGMWEQSLTPIEQYKKALEDIEKASKRLTPEAKERMIAEAQQRLEEALRAKAEQELAKQKKFRIDLEFGTVGLTDFNRQVQDAIMKGYQARQEEKEIKQMVAEQKRAAGLTETTNDILSRIETKLGMGA